MTRDVAKHSRTRRHRRAVPPHARGRPAGLAYLFVGPEGVGKRAFALKLAKALLCSDVRSCRTRPLRPLPIVRVVRRRQSPGHSCGRRRSRIRNILKIEQFIGDRDHRHQEGLCHDLSLRPLMGRRRVGIIDDADWFTQESANCLLKMLEEPPPGRGDDPHRHEPQPAVAHDPFARPDRALRPVAGRRICAS